jgi:putative peptidoglycan lipid II flippase
VQLSAFAQVLLASFLAAGALATLRYAQILYLLPVSLFGMSVAAAELTELSRSGSEDAQRVARRLQGGLGRIAVLVVPTAIGYLVVGDLITGALFRTGEFGRVDAVAVWIVLGGYAIGLLASTSSRLLQSSLYAIGDTRTPARLAVIRVVVSLSVGTVLMLQFDQFAVTTEGVQLAGELPAFTPLSDAARSSPGGGQLVRLGAAGLALATGLAAWLEHALLQRAVRRSIAHTQLGGGQLRPVLIAALPAAAVAAAFRPLLVDLHPLVGGMLAVAVVAATYLPLAAWLGVDEARTVLGGLRRLKAR